MADTVTLAPVVTDDGWGGALAYAWTQLSGPAIATISDPTALETDVTFADLAGAYLFQIAVTRADDDLTGIAVWRVYVLAHAETPDDARGAITVTVNGVPTTGLLNSVRISETKNGTHTCQFSIYGGRIDDPAASDAAIAVFNDVIISRHNDETDEEVRLFAGICLSCSLTIEADVHLFYHPSLVGYAWHLTRAQVTKTYTNWPIGSIALDLLAMAPGGLTGEFVALGLPVASIGFEDEPLDAAFTRLTQLEQDLHWTVDYFKRLHVAVTEPDGDPVALSLTHPKLRDLAITTDGSQVVNRVRVYYTTPVPEPDDASQAAAPPAPTVGPITPGDTEIQVQSLEGYSPSGGSLVLGGSLITYSGTRSGLIDAVYGGIEVFYFSRTERELVDGELTIGSYVYSLTYSTAEGETPAVATWSGVTILDVDVTNAIEIAILNVSGAARIRRRLTAINLYRTSSETPHAGDSNGTFHVGSVSPRGGVLVDRLSKAHLAPIQLIPEENTADLRGYWLTGVTISKPIATGAPVKTYVEVEDTAAQAALAVRLGGGDSGVIALVVQGGSIAEAEARTLGRALLDAAINPRLTATGGVYDDAAHPGQWLSLAFPAPPISCVADLKIQQATISGFEGQQPHDHRITAATEVVTLEDLLRHRAGGPS